MQTQQGRFTIYGISCEGCAWLAQQIIKRESKTVEADIHVATKQILLTWTEEADLPALAQALQRFGFILDKKGPVRQYPPPSKAHLIFGGIFAISALLFQLPRYLEVENFALGNLFNLMTALLVALSMLAIGHYAARYWQFKRLKS